jgi:hypothetical protein
VPAQPGRLAGDLSAAGREPGIERGLDMFRQDAGERGETNVIEERIGHGSSCDRCN